MRDRRYEQRGAGHTARIAIVLWTFSVALLAASGPALAQFRTARALREIRVESDESGWALDLEFEFAVQYLRHSPQKPGRTLRIQVSPLALGDNSLLSGPLRENLPIPRLEPGPLVGVVYDSSLPGEAIVEIEFSRPLTFSVRQGEGLRTLRIRADNPPLVSGPEAPADRGSQLLARARDSIRDGDLDLAIALLTRVLELPEEETTQKTKMDARELVALTYERRGQLAHAQSEYEAYLRDYPDGPAALRVRQRLETLISASEAPREPLRRSTKAIDRREGSDERNITSELFGSVSARYFRAESVSDDLGGDFLATNLLTDMDVAGRLETETWTLRGDFTGTRDFDLADDGRSDDTRISRLTVQVEDRIHGLEATLGRQRRSDGGVLGRFDGLYLSADLGSHYAVSALAGFPVESTYDSKPNTDAVVAGGAFSFRNLWIEGLEGQLFVIGEQVQSLNNRTAIGAEIRFVGDETYSFAYIDYDVVFQSLNTLLLSSSYRPSPETDYRVLIERRNSPILTLRTALQGQPVDDLDGLNEIFSESEIRDLARDRTAAAWAGTAGATHRPNTRYQVSGDLTVGYIESTKTSGGVEGSPSIGPDVSASFQLILNDWLVEDGIGSVAIRYFEGDASRSFTSAAYARFLLPHKLRVLPRIRWEWRDSQTQGSQSLLRPSLETDWRYSSFLLNAEAGIQWREPISGGSAFREVTYFVEAGIRWEF